MLRNFLEYMNQMTAAEWQLFTFLLAPVYMKDVLPDEDYNEYISLVEAIQISCDYVLTLEDILDMDEGIVRFNEYYQRRYYRMEWARLKACLPVFHQILHVPQALCWAGPLYVYSQWAMERFCGTLARSAKSRVATNRNISNNLVILEQKNTLVYVVDQGTPETVADEDSDGNIRLGKFVTKRLKNACPTNADITGSLAGPRLEVDSLIFCGPSQAHTLTTYERTCLKTFFFNLDCDLAASHDRRDLEADAHGLDIPTKCHMYRSASYNTCKRGDSYPFKSTSSAFRRSDQTRSTSFVRFESNHGGKQTHFGEVLFYFTIEPANECPYVIGVADKVNLQLQEKERGHIRGKGDTELMLAFLRHFPVIRDGRLLYREKHFKGVLMVIMAIDIHELIGLLEKDKRECVIRKQTVLF